MESNVIPVEAVKFLEDETPAEILNNDGPTAVQDGEDEDLVSCKGKTVRILYNFHQCFFLVRSHLKNTNVDNIRYLVQCAKKSNNHVCR